MFNEFIKHLSDIKYPSKKQSIQEMWDVEGRLKKSNRAFKFNVRPMKKIENKLQKNGYFNTKADKLVFETTENWIVFDTEELHDYLKNNKLNTIHLDDLIYKLDWNIIISKNESNRE